MLYSLGRLEKEDLNVKLSKLSKRIDAMKVEVYDSLFRKYQDFNPNLSTAVELNQRVQALSEEMVNISNKIDKEVASSLP